MQNKWFDLANSLDKEDQLASLAGEFYKKQNTTYLDGNSLGLLSKRAESSLLRVMDEWKELAIDGWLDATSPWYFMAEKLAAMTAPLVGAKPEEVIVANSTTVNLHQLVATFFEPTQSRNKIMTDALSFPSDIYALESQLRLRGLDPSIHLVKVQSKDGYMIDEADIVEAMREDIHTIVLQVSYTRVVSC